MSAVLQVLQLVSITTGHSHVFHIVIVNLAVNIHKMSADRYKIILKQDIQPQKTEISNLHVPPLLFISNRALFDMGWCNALKKKKSNVSYVLRGF